MEIADRVSTRCLQPLLARTGKRTPKGSSIVDVSSVLGIVGMANASAHGAVKGGVRMFTKSIALEFAHGRTPIPAISARLGFVETPMLVTAQSTE